MKKDIYTIKLKCTKSQIGEFVREYATKDPNKYLNLFKMNSFIEEGYLIIKKMGK